MPLTNYGCVKMSCLGWSTLSCFKSHSRALSCRSGRSRSLLQEAVERYMNAIGEGHHEDCLRAFLRLHVRDLGGLLPQLAELVRQSVSTLHENSAKVIPQANQVVLVCALLEC